MADQIHAADVAALVQKTLTPPVMGFAGGSAVESHALGRWRLECRAELARIREALGAPALAPEVHAVLDVVGRILGENSARAAS